MPDMLQEVTKIYSVENSDELIAILNHSDLHNYIITRVAQELSNLVENCYYPKVLEIYKELLHRTKSKEAALIKYSKAKWPDKSISKFKNLHTPTTTLLTLIMQDFLRRKDIPAAQSTYHLFALSAYTSQLYRFTTRRENRGRAYCNSDYFSYAMNNISRNHMFSKQKTIPNSIIYYSKAEFKRYYQALIEDDTEQIYLMIYSMRTKMAQSMRSFFGKYYYANDNRELITKREQENSINEAQEVKLRRFVERISQDMCVHGKVNDKAVVSSSALVKFNKKLSQEYAIELSKPEYFDSVNLACYLLLHGAMQGQTNTSVIKNIKFLDYVKKQLAIKITKKPVYFKKTISGIHDSIVTNLELLEWYEKLSVQSKAISRNFIAYYIAFYLRNYF